MKHLIHALFAASSLVSGLYAQEQTNQNFAQEPNLEQVLTDPNFESKYLFIAQPTGSFDQTASNQHEITIPNEMLSLTHQTQENDLSWQPHDVSIFENNGQMNQFPDVRFVCITPDAEKTIAYIARVSNPKNQANENIVGLLRYCIKNAHWSIFEQAFMTVEITTSISISMQLIRHRTFTFEQFSQRYQAVGQLTDEIPLPELRSQDTKNRQNSFDNLTTQEKEIWHTKIKALYAQSYQLYQDMLTAGIAKECARFVLPVATPTRLYMTGSIRSWIHYIMLRSENGTQKEHADIAKMIKQIFIEKLPSIAKALEWSN